MVEPHHSLSHHRDDPAFIAKKAKIDAYHIKLYSYFLDKLDATPDGDGSLLDHSIIMYGGGLGNPNLHEHSNLPVLLAGGGGGELKTGRHLAYPASTPMTNLLVVCSTSRAHEWTRSATAPARWSSRSSRSAASDVGLYPAQGRSGPVVFVRGTSAVHATGREF